MPVDFEKNTLAKLYEYYMKYMVAIFGYAWVYIGAAQVLASGDDSSVSVLTVTLFSIVTASFLVWGLLVEDPVLTVGSLVALVGALFLLTSVFFVRHVYSGESRKVGSQK
jgi:hypothetical protein